MEDRLDILKELLLELGGIEDFTNSGYLTKSGIRFLQIVLEELEYLREKVENNA